MDPQRKKRGENWSPQEKEILRHLICKLAKILGDKSTKTYINIQKKKEWKNLTIRHNKIAGKHRTDKEIKLAWKRMKLAAKHNNFAHRQALFQADEKPILTSPQELAIMSIAPYDFEIEINNYDCDAALMQQKDTENEHLAFPGLSKSRASELAIPGPSNSQPSEIAIPGPSNNQASEIAIPGPTNSQASEIVEDKLDVHSLQSPAPDIQTEKSKKGIKNRKKTRRGKKKSKMNFTKRSLEMLEKEHGLINIQIALLKIKKLQLEIEILQDKKNMPK